MGVLWAGGLASIDRPAHLCGRLTDALRRKPL